MLFFYLSSVKIEIWRKLIISLTNFNATLSTNIKQLSLNLLSRIKAFKWNCLPLLWNVLSDYSCTRNGKSGMVWNFHMITHILQSTCKSAVFCQLFHDGGGYHIETSPLIWRAITAFVMKESIGDSIITNFSKFSHMFDKYFSKFHPLNFGIRGDKIQNVIWQCA